MCGYFWIGFIDFIFAGKTLINFTSLFSLDDFEKNDNVVLSYLKNKYRQFYWSSQYICSEWSKKLKLNEINKIKDYFNSEIQERKIMSKKGSKYIAAFDYIDKL